LVTTPELVSFSLDYKAAIADEDEEITFISIEAPDSSSFYFNPDIL
jgi:hypothetical protein